MASEINSPMQTGMRSKVLEYRNLFYILGKYTHIVYQETWLESRDEIFQKCSECPEYPPVHKEALNNQIINKKVQK